MNRVRAVIGTGQSVTHETRMQIGDEVLWFLIRTPHSRSDGNIVGIAVICRNITDVKRAEEGLKASLKEKEVLLKEIHHRVKNNLQAISGILNLQAHQPAMRPRDLYRKSQERVLSIALIHENLYRTRDLERVDIARYIGDLVGNLLASYGNQSGLVELDLQVDPANMVMDTAIPVGLILNELISNSLKHAFPDDRSGNLRVEFKALDQTRYLSRQRRRCRDPDHVDIEADRTSHEARASPRGAAGGSLTMSRDEGPPTTSSSKSTARPEPRWRNPVLAGLRQRGSGLFGRIFNSPTLKHCIAAHAVVSSCAMFPEPPWIDRDHHEHKRLRVRCPRRSERGNALVGGSAQGFHREILIRFRSSSPCPLARGSARRSSGGDDGAGTSLPRGSLPSGWNP